MYCNQTTELIDEYLDGTLGAGERDELVRHIDSCDKCQQQRAATESLRSRLREMPVPSARENFARQAIEFAVQQGNQGSQEGKSQQNRPAFLHWFGAGFAGAMVAGLALWGVIVTFQPLQVEQPAASFSIALHQQRNISLAFNAPSAVKGVTVSIDLPEQFELVGHKGRRQLTWKTDLKKGRNVLTLPVIANAKGDGMLVARLSRKKQVKTLRILLATENPELSQYRITSEIAV